VAETFICLPSVEPLSFCFVNVAILNERRDVSNNPAAEQDDANRQPQQPARDDES
jgi:hypothetical protein